MGFGIREAIPEPNMRAHTRTYTQTRPWASLDDGTGRPVSGDLGRHAHEWNPRPCERRHACRAIAIMASQPREQPSRTPRHCPTRVKGTHYTMPSLDMHTPRGQEGGAMQATSTDTHKHREFSALTPSIGPPPPPPPPHTVQATPSRTQKSPHAPCIHPSMAQQPCAARKREGGPTATTVAMHATKDM